MPAGLKCPFYGKLLASGTRNLLPAIYNKTQNNKITLVVEVILPAIAPLSKPYSSNCYIITCTKKYS